MLRAAQASPAQRCAQGSGGSYPPNEFAGPEEERKGPTEHRRLYLGRTVSLSFSLPPLIAIRL
jgi:hypothetical protein